MSESDSTSGNLPHKALIVDPDAHAVERLIASLQPEVCFDELDHANSVFNAVQGFMSVEYLVCLVSNRISPDDIKVLVHDVGALQGRAPVLFVLVNDPDRPQLSEADLKNLGLSFSISQAPRREEKLRLLGTITTFIDGPIKKGSDISKYTDWMLQQIDKISYSMKRGVAATPIDIVSRYVREKMDEDMTIPPLYFDKLMAKTESAEAPLETKLVVPEEITQRALPKLREDGYGGVSHRVFVKLSKKFGKKGSKDVVAKS